MNMALNKDSALRDFLRTARVVAWSFIGIRKRSEFLKDVGQVKPIHVIAVGLMAGLLFVFTLIFVVNLILSV